MKREKKERKRQLRKRKREESSEDEDEVNISAARVSRGEVGPPRKKKKKTEEELLEEKRQKDYEERMEFEARLMQKEEEEKQRKAFERLTEEEKAALAENRRRKAISELTFEELQEEVENARVKSRSEYLKNRQDDLIDRLAREIEDERDLFPWDELTAEERINFKNKEKRLKAMIEMREAQNASYDGYVMPDSKANQARAKQNELLKRYQKEEKSRTDQDSWEASKVAAAQSQFSRGVWQQGKEYDLVIEDQEELIQFELAAGFDPEEEVKEEIKKGDRALLRQEKKVSLQEQRKNLPIFAYRQGILDAVREFQVLVIVAETGSGKTTQIPQYLFEDGYGHKGHRIAVTQPRRVAAMSVAKRVADEMGVKLGAEVGFTIRFEDMSSDKTVVKYCTDGMLLKEFLMEPNLKTYSAVMIDEAHERTLHTDILFGLVKDLAREREDLKVIISSATLDAEKFSNFFDDAPIFRVPGRTHRVEVYHTKNPEADYINACIVTIMQIHVTQVHNEALGDILVFLNGQDEIEAVEDILKDKIVKLGKKIKELVILPIYANLPSHRQALIFNQTPPNARKVVLATNIAETSLTIPGIVYVIDPGFHKQDTYHPRTGMNALLITPISQASAEQRKGRAGRISDGKCFRLYTQIAFEEEMDENTTPEIQRTNLSNVVLMMKSLGIHDFVNFDFMDPPPHETLIKALEHLYALNALNHRGELTKLGRRMAEFPLDPQLSKALVESETYGCSKEILTIAAVLSCNSSLFYRPRDQMVDADNQHKTFWTEWGDHFTFLNVYNQWIEAEESRDWCQTCFIQWKSMNRAKQVHIQIENLMQRVEIPLESSEDPIAIRKALLSGYFYNSARMDRTGTYKTTTTRQQVDMYPGSCLFNKEQTPVMVMFHELVLTSKEFMRTVSEIEPEWLLEVAPHFFKKDQIRVMEENGRKLRRRKTRKAEALA